LKVFLEKFWKNELIKTINNSCLKLLQKI
jgi:hypothetical protein